MGLDMYLKATKEIDNSSSVGKDLLHALAREARYREEDGISYTYLSGYSFSDIREKQAYGKIVSILGIEEYVDPETPGMYVSFTEGSMMVKPTVAYWRKANQIHLWFVENVQDGVDECQDSPCSRMQIRDLRDLASEVLAACELTDGMVWNGTTFSGQGGVVTVQEIYEKGKILVDSRLAREKLPTTSGFFFGSTDYDEGYVYDLVETVKQLDRALAMPDDWDFEYHSSW